MPLNCQLKNGNNGIGNGSSSLTEWLMNFDLLRGKGWEGKRRKEKQQKNWYVNTLGKKRAQSTENTLSSKTAAANNDDIFKLWLLMKEKIKANIIRKGNKNTNSKHKRQKKQMNDIWTRAKCCCCCWCLVLSSSMSPLCLLFFCCCFAFSKKLYFFEFYFCNYCCSIQTWTFFFLLLDLKGFDLQKAWIFCCIAAVVAVVIWKSPRTVLHFSFFRLTERKCKKSQGETTRIRNKKQAAAAASFALMMESRIFSRSS